MVREKVDSFMIVVGMQFHAVRLTLKFKHRFRRVEPKCIRNGRNFRKFPVASIKFDMATERCLN